MDTENAGTPVSVCDTATRKKTGSALYRYRNPVFSACKTESLFLDIAGVCACLHPLCFELTLDRSNDRNIRKYYK